MCTRGACASEGGYGQRFQEGYDCCRSLTRPVLALSFVHMALLEGELQVEMYCRAVKIRLRDSE